MNSYSSLSSELHHPSYHTAPESIRLLHSESIEASDPTTAKSTSSPNSTSSEVGSSDSFPNGPTDNAIRCENVTRVETSEPITYHDSGNFPHQSIDLISSHERNPSRHKITVVVYKVACKCTWVPCVFSQSWASRIWCYFSALVLLCSMGFLIAGLISIYYLTVVDSESLILFTCAASGLGLALLIWNVMFICKWRQQGRYNMDLFESSLDWKITYTKIYITGVTS